MGRSFYRLRLAFLPLCAACSKYALMIPDAGPPFPTVSVRIPESLNTARDKLFNYLESRKRLESVYVPPGANGSELRINQPWLRATSLRYYELEFDQRVRHIVSWKGQWVLKAVPPNAADLQLKVIEAVYAGPPREAGPEPKLDNQWYESERDGLRSAFELRRYWIEKYPDQRLPDALTNLKAPELAGPPLAKNLFEPRWKPLLRHRAF